MPRAIEAIYVVAAANEQDGTPAYAVIPGAFDRSSGTDSTRHFEFDGPELLTELPAEVDGTTLERDMVLWGTARVFVDRGALVRPGKLRFAIHDTQNGFRSKKWD